MKMLHEILWLLKKPYLWFSKKITGQLQEQLYVLELEMSEKEKQNQSRIKEMEAEWHTMADIFNKQMQLFEKRLDEAAEDIAATENKAAWYSESVRRIQVDISAIAREVMLAKWQAADLSLQEDGSDMLICRICGYSQRRDLYETKESDCIFYGGRLVRYVCPKCGVIFGPTKFMDMEQSRINDDYHVHYLGFSEGDSSEKEEKAFFMLQPSKEGVYLNYGCGHWSDSLNSLRKQGYQVFGYEPYASDADHPYMITNKQTLKKMRFDGIYSNDVLEHLLDPVDELVFMRSLLINENSKMAHSTSCYIYKYEYTRFHTHFFTGDAVSVMCKASGLKTVNVCNEMKDHDFICYVFTPDERMNDMLLLMHIKNNGKTTKDGTVILCRNGVLYGPYLHLAKREYCLELQIQGEAMLRITADCGQYVFGEYNLHTGINQIRFNLKELQENIEFVTESKSDRIIIDNIRLS